MQENSLIYEVSQERNILAIINGEDYEAIKLLIQGTRWPVDGSILVSLYFPRLW